MLAFCCVIYLNPAAEAQSEERGHDTRAHLLNQAIEAAQNGRLDDALKIDEELLRQSPALVPALKLHGALLEQLGRAQEADDAYSQALRLTPRDADLMMKRALLALRRADDPLAIEELKRYCQLRPSDADSQFYLAQALHRNGQPGEALNLLRQAIRLNRSRAEFLQKLGEWLTTAGNPKDGVTYLKQAQRIDPSLDEIEFDLGLAAYYDLDYASAATMTKAAVLRAPDDRKALQLLASSLEQVPDWPGALAAYEDALRLDPENAKALLGAGHAQLELGRAEAARDLLKLALNRDPALAQAHFYLARAHAKLGNTEEARHEFELHEKMMQYAYAPSALGEETGKATWERAKQLMLADRESEAVTLLASTVKDANVHPGEAYVLSGSLCLSLGRWQQGRALLHRGLELQPTVRGAHTYLGLAALEDEQLAEAEQEFQQELELHINYLPALEGMGELRYRQQRWEEVVRELGQAHSTSQRSLYLLTDSYFHINQPQNARLSAEMAVALSGNDSEAIRPLLDLLKRNGETVLAEKLGRDAHTQ